MNNLNQEKKNTYNKEKSLRILLEKNPIQVAIEDMKELDIQRKDFEEKSGNYHLLKEKKKTETNRKKIVISKAETKNRSDGMKTTPLN